MEVSGQIYVLATLPQGKSPWYPLDRRLGEAHRWSGHSSEEKNSLPLLGIETQLASP